MESFAGYAFCKAHSASFARLSLMVAWLKTHFPAEFFSAVPAIRDNEVLVKIKRAAICGTDIHIYNWDDWSKATIPVPLTIGHEFVGRIESSAAPGFDVGTRWTGNPLITCGRCDYCVQGRNNLCAERTMVGMTRPGAFAELMSIPAASLIAMPQQMPALVAALTPVLGADGVVTDAAEREAFFALLEEKGV